MIYWAIAIDNQHAKTNNSHLRVVEDVSQQAFGVRYAYKMWNLEPLVLEENVDTVSALGTVRKEATAIRYKI